MGNALWVLIRNSDTMTTGVLSILLGMSVICWAVFFYKVILLRVKKRQLRRAYDKLRRVDTFDELLASIADLASTLPGFVLAKGLTSLKAVLRDREKAGSLQTHEWEALQDQVAQTVDDLVISEESYLPVLSTSAQVATLLGLFGTVWGLMHSFMRIAEQQSADITTVAPGIAEALTTTLVGLMVAIPALVLYNYLIAQVAYVEQRLGEVADEFLLIVHRLFVR